LPTTAASGDDLALFCRRGFQQNATGGSFGIGDFTTAKQLIMKDIVWARFTWSMRDLKVSVPMPKPYRCRSARNGEDQDVLGVVLTAYASDPVWRDLFDGIRDRMTKRVNETFGKTGYDYIVAELDQSIVAVSGVARSHWTDQNLLTGICVVPEHQRKGLGRYLLAASLLSLRDMGLATAQVYTESGSLADRKLYPLFGSRREEGVDYPGLRPQPT
jgi:ribosomal protein S18 acetylase RimI-like enzyme